MGPNAQRPPDEVVVVNEPKLSGLRVRTKDRGEVLFRSEDDGTAGVREPRRSPRPGRPAGGTMTA
jgi:hypothetical protein